MRIGGFQKFSLIDYPGKCSAVVFTQGCNFRCPYCHNPELVHPTLFEEPLDVMAILGFLSRRRGLLDGVVVTGGEPTLHHDLPEFLARLKAMGFSVKLDTNGGHPIVLSDIITHGLADFIAMDVKAPFEDYNRLAGVKVNIEAVQESINLIQRSGLEHLFRTTYPPDLLTEKDIRRLSNALPAGHRYVVQPCSPLRKSRGRREQIN